MPSRIARRLPTTLGLAGTSIQREVRRSSPSIGSSTSIRLARAPVLGHLFRRYGEPARTRLVIVYRMLRWIPQARGLEQLVPETTRRAVAIRTARSGSRETPPFASQACAIEPRSGDRSPRRASLSPPRAEVGLSPHRSRRRPLGRGYPRPSRAGKRPATAWLCAGTRPSGARARSSQPSSSASSASISFLFS